MFVLCFFPVLNVCFSKLFPFDIFVITNVAYLIHSTLIINSLNSELNRFQWRPNLPFVISAKCLIKNTHIKKNLHITNDTVPFCTFLLAIALSVLLRYTDSDYPFGIFKLLLHMKVHRNQIINISVFSHPIEQDRNDFIAFCF
jgi:hypothetical protein